MKLFTKIFVFKLTLIIGVCFGLLADSQNSFTDECTVWDEDVLETSHFDFEDLKEFSGQKVRATKNIEFSDNVGRVSYPMEVAKGKYMLIIHWDNHPLNGQHGNDLFDKKRFENLGVEVID